MSLLKGKQVAVNTLTGGNSGNLALTTVDAVNVNGSVLSTKGVGSYGTTAFFDAAGPGGATSLISNVKDPVAAQDAATKNYVDTSIAGIANGISWKQPVVAATTDVDGNIDLATGGLLIIDGYQTQANDRILVKNQTDPAENGIYIASAGAWVRSADANTAAELNGAAVVVTDGTDQADSVWLQMSTVTTIGVSPVNFNPFPSAYVAGEGIDPVQFAAGTIAVLAGPGITFDADAVTIDLATSGAGTGGLQFNNTDQLEIFSALNNGTAASPTYGNSAEGGLKLTSNGLSAQLAPTDTANQAGGLKIAGGLSVNLLASGGLEISDTGPNGIAIKIAATVPGNGALTPAYGGLKTDNSGASIKIAAEKALLINGSGELEFQPRAANSGLAIDSGVNGGAYVVQGNGIVVGTDVSVNYGGTPPAVAVTGAAGVALSVSRSDHTHASPQPVIADHGVAGLAVAQNSVYSPVVGSGLSYTPVFSSAGVNGSYVAVKCNGVQYSVGNGTKDNCAFYFSGDGGTTARDIGAIVAGDVLCLGKYDVGNSLGIFAIETSDSFDFDYLAFIYAP